MTTPSELAAIKVTAARNVRLVWRLFPYPAYGALILTGNLLRFESAMFEPPFLLKLADRNIVIPLDGIVDVRVERWPHLFLLIPAAQILLFWPGFRRLYQTNLCVKTKTTTHHFRVRNPQEWVRALKEP